MCRKSSFSFCSHQRERVGNKRTAQNPRPYGAQSITLCMSFALAHPGCEMYHLRAPFTLVSVTAWGVGSDQLEPPHPVRHFTVNAKHFKRGCWFGRPHLRAWFVGMLCSTPKSPAEAKGSWGFPASCVSQALKKGVTPYPWQFKPDVITQAASRSESDVCECN